jgi:hypothetical protein
MLNCEKEKLGFNLDLWRGAYVSIQNSEIGLTWNINSINI